MSSFFGHSLAAIGVYSLTKTKLPESKSIFRIFWLPWLIIVASAPDLDYLVKFLHSSNNQGLRVTHSLLFCLILPLITITVLFFLGVKGRKLSNYSGQLFLVAFSHLVLDLLVGVTPLPLLFFFSKHQFKLPWGILPSAGRPDLYNYYFYRNLLIEMGVLLPLLLTFLLIRYSKLFRLKEVLSSIFLISISVYFMNYAYNLPR